VRLTEQRLSERAERSGRYFIHDYPCHVCDRLKERPLSSIEEEKGGPASLAATKYPVHNWYTYVQTYSPEFVRHVMQKVGITRNDLIIDAFSGTGTTLVEARLHGVDSVGIEAIDLLAFVSRVKSECSRDLAEQLKLTSKAVREKAEQFYQKTCGDNFIRDLDTETDQAKLRYSEFLEKRYISPKSLAKLLALKHTISQLRRDQKTEDILMLALAGITLSCSNMRFGPEIGLKKTHAHDNDVFATFQKKIDRMVDDLKQMPPDSRLGKSVVRTGDSREMNEVLKQAAPRSQYQRRHIITSPPYPQDHDYTRSVRVESVLLGFARDMKDFRKLKERMVRSSTRSVYSSDNDASYVREFHDVSDLATEIDRRVKETGGTSGFEKLYSKLVREYFGGMYRFLTQAYEAVGQEGTVTLLVGDSHAFKMTHIETAKILEKLAKNIGFQKSDKQVWRYIRSPSQRVLVPENILTLYR
jgi:hypothetical protein